MTRSKIQIESFLDGKKGIDRNLIFLSVIPFIVLIFLIMALIWWRIDGEDQALTSIGEAPIDSIDLADYGSAGSNDSLESSFVVNGLLKADNGLVVSPSTDPANPLIGQLTFDINDNKLKYYDGLTFVDLLDTSADSSVCFESDPGQCGFNFIEGEYVAGNGISIQGRQVSSTGDPDPTDDITITSILGGEVSGTPINLSIQNNVIDSNNIVDGSITNADLLNDSVTVNTQNGLTGGGVVALGDIQTLQSTLGVDVDSQEIVNRTLREEDLGMTNQATNGDALTYDAASGTFSWVTPSTLGSSTSIAISDGTNTQQTTHQTNSKH